MKSKKRSMKSYKIIFMYCRNPNANVVILCLWLNIISQISHGRLFVISRAVSVVRQYGQLWIPLAHHGHIVHSLVHKVTWQPFRRRIVISETLDVKQYLLALMSSSIKLRIFLSFELWAVGCFFYSPLNLNWNHPWHFLVSSYYPFYLNTNSLWAWAHLPTLIPWIPWYPPCHPL